MLDENEVIDMDQASFSLKIELAPMPVKGQK